MSQKLLIQDKNIQNNMSQQSSVLNTDIQVINFIIMPQVGNLCFKANKNVQKVEVTMELKIKQESLFKCTFSTIFLCGNSIL